MGRQEKEERWENVEQATAKLNDNSHMFLPDTGQEELICEYKPLDQRRLIVFRYQSLLNNDYHMMTIPLHCHETVTTNFASLPTDS